jgi:hypothetical protein
VKFVDAFEPVRAIGLTLSALRDLLSVSRRMVVEKAGNPKTESR